MVLKDLPVGARVRDRGKGTVFLVCAQRHPGYGGTTLLAERLSGVSCFDAREPSSPGRGAWEEVGKYGNNDYELSNIHRWLNSADDGWYAASHAFDAPPEPENLRYGEHSRLGEPGFLDGLSGALREALLETEVPVLARRGKDEGSLTGVRARVFLPSRTEIGKGDESGFAEGRMMPLFHDPTVLKAKPSDEDRARYGRSWNPGRASAPYDAAQIYDPKYGWWFWLRTPSLKYAYLARVMSPYGAVSYTYAYNDVVGVRPMLNLDSGLAVLGDGAADEVFTVAG